MVNEHLSENIEIKRGFKQGDASSNGWFNLGMDPLIRNIIMRREIKMINIRTPRTMNPILLKAGAYADDVFTLCKADQGSVQGIFKQYERLTRRSGLELIADKTEILSMHTNASRVYKIQYCENEIELTTLKEIKICGIWYCREKAREYKLNVTDKIVKLENNLRL